MLPRDVELLFEVGCMRHIPRTWREFGGIPFANLAEHTMRIAWIAMLIAQSEGGDVGKIVRMALVHDLGETRTGDVNYVTRLYVKRDEALAVSDTLASTSLEKDMKALWEEVEAKETLEAKIVKDADNLDCDLEFKEQASNGMTWNEDIREIRLKVRERLFTETAKQLFDLIHSANPHDWHRKNRNRLTAGDWSEPLAS